MKQIKIIKVTLSRPVITLYVNRLNSPAKDIIGRVNMKTGSNYILSTRGSL